MTTIDSRQMNRRRFLQYGAAGTATAIAGSAGLAGLTRSAIAQGAPGQLTIGVLRAPASGIISLTQQNGWFRQAGVELKEELFAAAAGPKIIQALGGGAIGLSFVNSTAALLGLAGGAIPLRFISIPTDPSRNFCILSAAG